MLLDSVSCVLVCHPRARADAAPSRRSSRRGSVLSSKAGSSRGGRATAAITEDGDEVDEGVPGEDVPPEDFPDDGADIRCVRACVRVSAFISVCDYCVCVCAVLTSKNDVRACVPMLACLCVLECVCGLVQERAHRGIRSEDEAAERRASDWVRHRGRAAQHGASGRCGEAGRLQSPVARPRADYICFIVCEMRPPPSLPCLTCNMLNDDAQAERNAGDNL